MASKPATKSKPKTTVKPKQQAVAVNPGKNMGIAGFVLSFFSVLSIAGLVLSIVALVKSTKAKFKNPLAIAGIVLSAINIFFVTPFIIALSIGIAIGASDRTTAQNTCNEQDNIGIVTVDNTTYSCQPFGVVNTPNN